MSRPPHPSLTTFIPPCATRSRAPWDGDHPNQGCLSMLRAYLIESYSSNHAPACCTLLLSTLHALLSLRRPHPPCTTSIISCPMPPGNVHYYLNKGCDTAILVATWQAGTKTTFVLPLLQALPADLFGGLLSSSEHPAPKAKDGFPLIQDQECLKRCSAGGGPANATYTSG